MQLVLNCTATMHCNLMTDIQIAKETGFDGIEIIHQKLYRYLESGNTFAQLRRHLDGFPVAGVGAIWDCDRSSEAGRAALVREAERMSECAKELGCGLIQAVPGPVDLDVVQEFANGTLPDDDPRYRGFLGCSWEEIRRETAKNVRLIADIAAQNHQEVYLEPLGWAPFKSMRQAVEIVDASGADNVGVIVDTWHCYVAGDTPEMIAKLDKDFIKGVHVCDSLRFEGGVADQRIYRDIMTGAGAIYLQEWIDAIRSTGFDGWYACELFSSKHHELDPVILAATLRQLMAYLVQ